MKSAIIGGTGLGIGGFFEGYMEEMLQTPYGQAWVRRRPGGEVFFLARHGLGHVLAPHRVNYRANLWALKTLGVQRVIATNAVGAIDPALQVGDLSVADQLIDFTRNRPSTFFEDSGLVRHVDFTDPYCREVRAALLRAALEQGVPARDGVTYVAAEGPRYETAAEVKAFRLLGGHVVGMTGAPEAALAREIGLCYGCICLVTNQAAGVAPGTLSHREVEDAMARVVAHIREVLERALHHLPPHPACDCARTSQNYHDLLRESEGRDA
ncbi:MAG: S-methyl-5'-thioinosine phosphorylase [Bacillota bacterium]